MMTTKLIGNLHSYESCGTVDGPGLRFVVFMQGCPLRCRYCHNPDTWERKSHEVFTVDQVMEETVKYRSYMNFSGGGITVTGGEPLMQPMFVGELLRRCQTQGIHTVLDTSGVIDPYRVEDVYGATDLVLLDLKCMDPDIHRSLTGVDLAGPLKTAAYLTEREIPVWVRHVLVPSVNDAPILLEKLAQFIADMPNCENFELLPFHQLGEYKWQQLAMNYTLADVQPPTAEQMEMACSIFRRYGINPK